jgi:hypothetical protein
VIEKDVVVKPIEAFGLAVRPNWLSKSCEKTVLGGDDFMGDSSLRCDGMIFGIRIDGYSTHLAGEFVVGFHLRNFGECVKERRCREVGKAESWLGRYSDHKKPFMQALQHNSNNYIFWKKLKFNSYQLEF